MKAVAIIPTSLAWQPQRLLRAVNTGLDAAAEAVRVDFVATTNTWKNKPGFKVAKQGDAIRVISTSGKIWAMLDAGTRAHLIRPKRAGGRLAFRSGYRAKTTPGVLGSGGGGASGATVYSKGVRHPGTEARDWVPTAKRKYDDLFPKIMQRAIDAEVSS